MKKFNKTYQRILEDITVGSALGPTQAQPAQVGKSSDFYAPGDARNIWGKGGKKKKKSLGGFKKENIIRRTFPTM